MTDYTNGKIYIIRSHQTYQVYIGSTVQTLAKRVGGHRAHYKHHLKRGGNVTTSFEIIKHPDHYIELVEEYPCENKMQLERREGQIMRATDNCVNKNVAGRNAAEYRIDNVEYIK